MSAEFWHEVRPDEVRVGDHLLGLGPVSAVSYGPGEDGQRVTLHGEGWQASVDPGNRVLVFRAPASR